MSNLTPEQQKELLRQLALPFHPSQVTWKPGSVKKDGTRAAAMAYGDLRAYQNRLDELLGLNWSVTYTAWGDKVICHLTIHGVTRSSTGEPDSQSERSEIGGTSAEAQAFKRACAMFSLGRYLYKLPTVWVEYDANTKRFAETAQRKLDGIIATHYRRVMDENERELELASLASQAGEVEEAPKPTTTQPIPTQPTPEPFVDPAAVPAQGDLTTFRELGKRLYADQWDAVCQHNIDRVTGTTGRTAEDLTPDQLRRLTEGMQTLIRKRAQQSAQQAMTQPPARQVLGANRQASGGR